jgi:hypothetical protein
MTKMENGQDHFGCSNDNWHGERKTMIETNNIHLLLAFSRLLEELVTVYLPLVSLIWES